MAPTTASDLLLHIQPDSPVPIYEQIVTQITFAIASGALEPGAMIPSVRDLANRVLVHPNTVARAFQELERRGVVAAKRGRGMEVTAGAPLACSSQRREIVRSRIREALREAASSALTPEEIRQLVDEELARANGKSSRGDKAGPKKGSLSLAAALESPASEKRSHGSSD
ncbi:MAG TPA: GntR family transcriptional regulator [Gemmataceae bacterium]|nr:GntR family transcriptional regulator [Gemmataceae bacterium]